MSQKTFVTFGHGHKHVHKNQVFDHDCVAVVNGDRNKVFELFGTAWCFEYPEELWDDNKMKFFPRGYIEVEE